MALNPDIPVVVPGELITAEYNNNQRANLERLDAEKLDRFTGGVVEGPIQVGGNPAAGVAGSLMHPNGAVQSLRSVAGVNLQLFKAGPAFGTGQHFVAFYGQTTATVLGTITQASPSSVQFATSSDERLKTETGPVDPAAVEADLMALRVRRFRWSADDPDNAVEQVGLYAQEAVEIAPDIVSVGTGEPGDDEWFPWGIDYSKLVARLLVQVQRLTERVAELEAGT